MKAMLFVHPVAVVAGLALSCFFLAMFVLACRRLCRAGISTTVALRLMPSFLPFLLSLTACLTGVSAGLECTLVAALALAVCQITAFRDDGRAAVLAAMTVVPVLLFGLGLGRFACIWFFIVSVFLETVFNRRYLLSFKSLSRLRSPYESMGNTVIFHSLFLILLFSAAGSVASLLEGTGWEIFKMFLSLVLAVLFGIQYCRHCRGTDLLMGKRRMAVLEAAAPEVPDQAEFTNPDTCLRTIYYRFLTLLEEKEIYLDPHLTVGEAARNVFTNRNYLGRAISVYSGRNFCSFINSYRVRYAVEAFRKNPYLRINQLVDMSGFRTPSAFTLAFKLEMKKSPSEWCTEYRESHLK